MIAKVIAKLISRFAAKFEILIKIVLSPSWEAVFAIKRLVLARSWVRAPAESRRLNEAKNDSLRDTLGYHFAFFIA